MYLISVFNVSYKSAVSRLGRNVTYCRTSAGTAETSVCDKSNASVKTLADNSRRRSKHLRHTGTTLRSFIADNNNVTGDDNVIEDSVTSSLFAVKYLRSTCEVHHFGLDSTLLYNRAVFCKVTAEYCKTAVFSDRILAGVDYCTVCIRSLGDSVSLCTRNSKNARINVTALCKLLDNRLDTADIVKVCYEYITCRIKF